MDLPLMLIIVLFISLGIFSQWLAGIIKWPAIVVMSITGLLVGPVFQLANPEQMMGSGLYSTIVSLAVAIILFEGSSNLDYRELKGVSKAIRRVITIGAALAWFLGTLAMYYIMEFPLPISLVMAGLLIVTGPTVITPLLKQAKVKNSVNSILKWEGIILDPVGPLLALLSFYVFQVLGNGSGGSFILEFLVGFAVAAILGFGGSLLFRWLIKKEIIPQNLMAPIQFAFILLIFSINEAVLHESGLLSVTIFGLAMARMKNRNLVYKQSDHFIEEISLILVSTVFILITSSLTREVLIDVLNWQLAIFCLVMILLVRPLSIYLSTINTEIGLKERGFIGMTAPRGIVALTVAQFFAGLFIDAGLPMAEMITPVTFGFVFVTVVVYGFGFKPLSQVMNLSSTNPPGVIIIGENNFSLQLAKKLKDQGIPVMMSDLLHFTSSRADEMGIETFRGNLLSEDDRIYTDLTSYDKCLLMTRSFVLNNLSFNELSTEFGLRNVKMLPISTSDRIVKFRPEESLRHHMLFEETATYYWLDQYIKEHNISEIPGSEAETISENDIVLYYIDSSKNVHFKPITRELEYGEEGTIGLLKDGKTFKENNK
ncbi:cation:proton antiporter [Salinicoccus sp. HZC-1]|uniref:cation:proton antiporter n=1 Tax=Salinicoccus sp. HZC-1 TaxID=3385497 RepID=UPI00398B99AB